jgi:hypothetical protein
VLPDWSVFDSLVSQIHAMLSVDLVVLIILKFKSHEMAMYFWSYAEMKFDVDLHFCSIHDVCDVLLKIDAGFMLVFV